MHENRDVLIVMLELTKPGTPERIYRTGHRIGLTGLDGRPLHIKGRPDWVALFIEGREELLRVGLLLPATATHAATPELCAGAIGRGSAIHQAGAIAVATL